MSVVLSSGAFVESAMAGHEGFALVGFPAGLARALNQIIVRDPTPDQPAHALVVGKKTKGVKRALRDGSHWVVQPPDWADVHLP
jgi:hypothetical protein